jgi:hypothetical protein
VFKDRAAEQFGDLRHYGISELLKSVHPAGNPIMPSTHEGQGSFAKSMDKPICFFKRTRRWMDGWDQLPLSRLSDAFGVGNNPDAIPLVRGAKGGSGYTVPLRIVPERSEPPRALRPVREREGR